MDEERKEPGKAQPYLDAIKQAEKAFEVYQSKCANIEKLYASLSKMSDSQDADFQIFWASMEIMRPSVYQRPPRPVVMPRHSDTGEVPRKASEMLERVLEYDVEDDDLHETLKLVRDDLCLTARGVAWVLDNGAAIHVDRLDFLHEPARKWQEVGWVARRSYITRKEGVERFGKAFYDAELAEVGSDDDDGDHYQSTDKKAQVWEIWSRTEGKVVWVTEGIEDVLDEQPPLIDVKSFFPCPKPAYATLESRTLKPVPDVVFFLDQITEVRKLTRRIAALTESLRLKGFYAGGQSDIGEAIDTAMRQSDDKAILVPVAGLGALGNNAKDSVIWLPVTDVATVIRELIANRKQLIEDIYEITGLSDIMRGATEAEETLGAQQLKAQYGSIRVREKQGEMVRIALDVLRIKAEIYAENYSAAQLMQMAGMQIPTQAELMQAQQQQAEQQAMQQQQQPPMQGPQQPMGPMQ